MSENATDQLKELPVQGETSKLLMQGVEQHRFTANDIERELRKTGGVSHGAFLPGKSVLSEHQVRLAVAAGNTTETAQRAYWLRGHLFGLAAVTDLSRELGIPKDALQTAVDADKAQWKRVLEQHMQAAETPRAFLNALALYSDYGSLLELMRQVAHQYRDQSIGGVDKLMNIARSGEMPTPLLTMVMQQAGLDPASPAGQSGMKLFSDVQRPAASMPAQSIGGRTRKKDVPVLTPEQQENAQAQRDAAAARELAKAATTRFVSLASYALNKANLMVDAAYNPPPAERNFVSIAGIGRGLSSSRVGSVGGRGTREARWASDSEFAWLVKHIEAHAAKTAEQTGQADRRWYNELQPVLVGKTIERIPNFLDALRTAHEKAKTLRALANIENAPETGASMGK